LLPQAILVSDWFISKKNFSSETALPNEYAFYQVSVHLAKRFQRRFFKSANQKQELTLAAMFFNGSELNEQYL
jgi:hypothetical protein